MSKAREQGFEPRYLGPEPRVLPLDDSRALDTIINIDFIVKFPRRFPNFQ